eukprot:626965-Prymnesium_polylepis.1
MVPLHLIVSAPVKDLFRGLLEALRPFLHRSGESLEARQHSAGTRFASQADEERDQNVPKTLVDKVAIEAQEERQSSKTPKHNPKAERRCSARPV